MILYGAGGHAKVIYDRMQAFGISVPFVFDDNPEKTRFMNRLEVFQYHPENNSDIPLIITIGSNGIRMKLAEMVVHRFGTFSDLTAIVSNSSIIGEGTVILTSAVIQANAILGRHCIVNTGAIIEHDARIGDFAHIAPGAVLCGQANLGHGVFIGANATVLPGVTVGDWAVVGAGSVVTKNVKSGDVIAGNPAKSVNGI